MTRPEARALADKIILQLKPHIEKGRICGSFRRGKEELSDLDIVLLPKREPVKDLFGNITGYEVVPGFIQVVNSWERIIGDPTGKYCKRKVDGHKVEIAIVNENNYGLMISLKTGNSEFNIKIMNHIRKIGLDHTNGHLYKNGKMIPVPEETDFLMQSDCLLLSHI